MTRAASDPFPERIRVIRQRRRTVELGIEEGVLVARAPRRMPQRDLEPILQRLRQQLWESLCRERVFDDEALRRRAEAVRRRHLRDLALMPFEVGFTARQRRRWASCVHGDGRGRILVSHRLRGHPVWVLEHVLLHELIHLVHANHGPRFQELLARDPHAERARGYLEALESLEQIGAGPRAVETVPPRWDGTLPLFPEDRPQASSEPSASSARLEPFSPSDPV